MHPDVREASYADVIPVALNMRSEDVAEVKALSGSSPHDALTNGLSSSSRCFTYAPLGVPCALFGVVDHPAMPGVGAPWLLGTDAFKDNVRTIVEWTPDYIDELGFGYDLLVNFVDARNRVHIRWLRWAGFTFINRHDRFGVEKRPFYEFVRPTNV